MIMLSIFEKVCLKIQTINLVIQLFNKYLFSAHYVRGTILDQWSLTGGSVAPWGSVDSFWRYF